MQTWTEARPSPGPTGQHRALSRQRKPRRTWGQRLLILLGSLTSACLLIAALGLTWGLQRYRAINFVSVPNVEAAAPGEPSNWLLVGSDSRDGIDPNDPSNAIFTGGGPPEGKRTDTIMVARVDPEARTIDLLSVPRDLWVPISGTGENGRINGAFNGEAGEQRLVSTVEETLGIEINNYAEVNFAGFQAVIDAVGGVPIWFEYPVRDPGSALNIETPGCHILNGFESLAFARSRKLQYMEGGEWRSDPTGDLGRNSRQQFLLSRLADRASSQVGVTNIGAVDSIIRAGGENLLIDEGSGAGDLLGLARTFAGVGAEGVRRHALPVYDDVTSGGAQILRLKEDEAQEILEIYRGVEPPPDPSAFPAAEGADRSSFAIEIQNGAGTPGLAASTETELTAEGFTVSTIGDAPELVDRTVIRYPPGLEAAATELGRALAPTPLFELDDAASDLVLVLGPDYEGINDATVAGVTVTSAAPEAPPAPVQEDVIGIVPGPGPEGTECFF